MDRSLYRNIIYLRFRQKCVFLGLNNFLKRVQNAPSVGRCTLKFHLQTFKSILI